ncbi:MAG TPA: YceI family protein [Anaeromyxobacter sp.]
MQVLAILAAAVASAAPPAAERFDLAPAGPGIRIHVAKRGAFAMFAHDHDFEVTRWRGTAELPGGDPARAAVALALAAGSLHDREAKLSEADRRKVDAQAAGPEVLDAAHAPEITFRSEGASVEGAGASGGAVRGTIHGRLTLRGRTRPVEATFEAAREGEGWRVRGRARFKQSEFGIRPFSGFGGTVGVKDEVEVTFELALRPAAR